MVYNFNEWIKEIKKAACVAAVGLTGDLKILVKSDIF